MIQARQTDFRLLEGQAEREPVVQGRQRLLGHRNDFGTDTIARQYQKFHRIRILYRRPICDRQGH